MDNRGSHSGAQALTYAKDLVALLKEMNRVLKPGAKISFLDWFKLKAPPAAAVSAHRSSSGAPAQQS